MRVLITGATGFIGSHSLVALLRAGHEVRALVRDIEKFERVMAAHRLPMPEAVVGDITDEAAVSRALDGCESVIHTAAVVAVAGKKSQATQRTNTLGVELVIGGAAERGFPSIIYVSSASAIFTPGTGPVTADSPLANWQSDYALSKATSERYIRGLQESGAPIRSTYPPGVIGPHDPGMSDANYAVLTFLRQSLLRTSSGFETLDVRDLGTLHAALVDPSLPAGRYLVGGNYQPWPEVIDLMRELSGRHVPAPAVPGGLLRFGGRVGDIVRRIYDFQFPLTAEAMDHATQWPGLVPSPEIEKLGLPRRNSRETYEDTIRWMFEAGHLTAKQVGRLAEPTQRRMESS
jgi:nucleoside-diphosphate-sugar epimerase